MKCFSKSRLLRKRELVGSGAAARVVTALDKVQQEILTMQRLRQESGAHANCVCLQAVLTESGADDLFLGACCSSVATVCRTLPPRCVRAPTRYAPRTALPLPRSAAIH